MCELCIIVCWYATCADFQNFSLDPGRLLAHFQFGPRAVRLVPWVEAQAHCILMHGLRVEARGKETCVLKGWSSVVSDAFWCMYRAKPACWSLRPGLRFETLRVACCVPRRLRSSYVLLVSRLSPLRFNSSALVSACGHDRWVF